jgi:hypothetical protein
MSDGSVRMIELNRDITLQDYFYVVCTHYELAARFILNWYAEDTVASIEFITTLLITIRNELKLMDSWLTPRNPTTSTLHSPESSVCRVSLLRFCELLHESPELIEDIQTNDNYVTTTEGYDFFLHREKNIIALTRGTSWEVKGFGDPKPIPIDIRKDYYHKCYLEQQRERQLKEQEIAARKEAKARASAEKLKAGIENNRANKIKSEERRLFRQYIGSLPIDLQLMELATNTDYPVSVFSDILPNLTKEMIELLSEDQRNKLRGRIAGRWENNLIDLMQLIDSVKE